MNVKKLLVALGTSGLMMALVAGPTFAASVKINKNGSDSYNKVSVSKRTSKHYSQSNNTSVSNVIMVTSKTGNNEAEDNTGGNVKVKSGNVNTTISVANGGSVNDILSDDCGCESTEEHDVVVKGNGTDTTNKVELKDSNRTTRRQRNHTSVGNLFDLYFNTGDNEAEDNTGGKSTVESGHVTTDVVVINESSANYQ